MKKHLALAFFCLLSVLFWQAPAAAVDLSNAQMSALEELKLMTNKLEDGELEKESFVKALSNEIATRAKESDELPSTLAALHFGYAAPQLVIQPISEHFGYIDGAPCHVGHYADFSLITVFEGINRGSQLTLAYDGRVLFVNSLYQLEITPIGFVFTHTYDNAVVVTGANQVMYLY